MRADISIIRCIRGSSNYVAKLCYHVHFNTTYSCMARFITDSTGAVRLSTAKVKRVAKDPAIRSGFPLPEDGICRHYKKSFRWFRYSRLPILSEILVGRRI